MGGFWLLRWIPIPTPQPPPPLRSPQLPSPSQKKRRKKNRIGSRSDSPPVLDPSMGTSQRLFGRRRSVHEILGGGVVADVMLWRRGNETVGILLVTLAAWVVFERSGYTLLSLVANTLLLLVSIVFVWAKAAGVLNRPPPPIPELRLSEEVINEASAFLHSHVNTLLSAWHDISLGKDTRLFYKVAASLWVISIVGSWTDFLTLSYTSLVIVLTVPELFEKHGDHVDRYAMLAYVEVQRIYDRLDAMCFNEVRKWILEKRKLS